MNNQNLETSFEELNAVELASCQGGVAERGINLNIDLNPIPAHVYVHVNPGVEVYVKPPLGDNVSLSIDRPLS